MQLLNCYCVTMVSSFKTIVTALCFIYLSLNLSYCYDGNDVLLEGQPCVIEKTKTTGCCRNIKNCPSALVELKNKERPTICSFAKDEIIACCLTACYETSTPKERLILDYNETTVPRSSDERISKKKCHEYYPTNSRYRRDVGAFKLPPDFDDGNIYAPAAVGGEDAHVNEFPHMAAIAWYTVNGSLAFNCGGTLISENFVVTAAHCTKAPSTNFLQQEPSIVRLGEQNIVDGIIDGTDPIDVPIKRIIVHPQYKPPKKYYDIALIELNNTVKFSSHIMPACLWENRDFKPYISAVVTGWGTTVSGGTSNSPVLQKVWLDIIDDAQCDSLLLKSRNRHWNGLQEHQMCAGVLLGGKDACQGDSGGPLQVKLYYYSIIGITSFGKQCAKANQPGIYTKVSYFLDWIEDNVWHKT